MKTTLINVIGTNDQKDIRDIISQAEEELETIDSNILDANDFMSDVLKYHYAFNYVLQHLDEVKHDKGIAYSESDSALINIYKYVETKTSIEQLIKNHKEKFN